MTPRCAAAAIVGLALAASACSATDDRPAAAGMATDLAFSAEDASARPDTTAEPSAIASTAPTTPSSSPPTTAGRGLAPVTTAASSAGGDPAGLYRGVLGTLGPDDIVTAGAGPPPTVSAGILPLTGLPGVVPDRPAAVVKVDNGSSADPQTGLNQADIVIEEEVEGGVTRFAAIFHSTSTVVGPVRSGRTTDVALISSLGSPLYLYSGANDVTEGILRALPGVQNRNQATSSGYWRDDSRRAPSNLYTDTEPHWASAVGDPPPPQFAYRPPGGPIGDDRAGGEATELTVAYAASTARWRWDGARWLRWQRGEAHRVRSGEQISADNVVIIEAERVDTGLVDAAGGVVPEFVFVGTGRATVYTDGRRIEGRWTRPTLASVATLTHGAGVPIELTPGRTWVQLVEAGSGALR